MQTGVQRRAFFRRGEGPATVYEAARMRARSNTEHADSVLAAILSQERSNWDWPAAVHAIVLDMPMEHRRILLGVAHRATQQEMAECVGWTQQQVSEALALIRPHFMARLRAVGSTQRMCYRLLGVTVAELEVAA